MKQITMRDRLSIISKEAKRAAPPWGLIIVGAILMALATSCIVGAVMQ